MPSLVDRESDKILFPYFHFNSCGVFMTKNALK